MNNNYSSFKELWSRDPAPLLEHVASGATLLLHPISPDTEIPVAWLPGDVRLFPANMPEAVVKDVGHPLAAGESTIRAEPMSNRGKPQPTPNIRLHGEATAPWRTVTSPGVLFTCPHGDGHIIINCVPDNRALFLRCLLFGQDQNP